MKDHRIEDIDRKKLVSYIKKFMKLYPQEKYSILTFVRRFKNRHRGKIINTEYGKKRIGTKQTYMPVIGETGTGKSYFGIMSCILYGRPFTLDRHISYVPESDEISKRLDQINFGTYVVDEGAKALRSFNWQNKGQQKVTEKAQTDRYKANWIFIMIPNYDELTKSIRLGSSTFRAYIPYRTNNYARVIIHKKTRNFRHDDPWGDKLANKMYEKKEKKSKEITNDDILNIERRSPNYVMDFIIPNLELVLPKICHEYLNLKEESRKQKEEQKTVVDFWKDNFAPRAAKIIYRDELGIKEGARVTQERLAKALGISKSSLVKLLD